MEPDFADLADEFPEKSLDALNLEREFSRLYNEDARRYQESEFLSRVLSLVPSFLDLKPDVLSTSYDRAKLATLLKANQGSGTDLEWTRFTSTVLTTHALFYTLVPSLVHDSTHIDESVIGIARSQQVNPLHAPVASTQMAMCFFESTWFNNPELKHTLWPREATNWLDAVIATPSETYLANVSVDSLKSTAKAHQKEAVDAVGALISNVGTALAFENAMDVAKHLEEDSPSAIVLMNDIARRVHVEYNTLDIKNGDDAIKVAYHLSVDFFVGMHDAGYIPHEFWSTLPMLAVMTGRVSQSNFLTMISKAAEKKEISEMRKQEIIHFFQGPYEYSFAALYGAMHMIRTASGSTFTPTGTHLNAKLDVLGWFAYGILYDMYFSTSTQDTDFYEAMRQVKTLQERNQGDWFSFDDSAENRARRIAALCLEVDRFSAHVEPESEHARARTADAPSPAYGNWSDLVRRLHVSLHDLVDLHPDRTAAPPDTVIPHDILPPPVSLDYKRAAETLWLGKSQWRKRVSSVYTTAMYMIESENRNWRESNLIRKRVWETMPSDLFRGDVDYPILLEPESLPFVAHNVFYHVPFFERIMENEADPMIVPTHAHVESYIRFHSEILCSPYESLRLAVHAGADKDAFKDARVQNMEMEAFVWAFGERSQPRTFSAFLDAASKFQETGEIKGAVRETSDQPRSVPENGVFVDQALRMQSRGRSLRRCIGTWPALCASLLQVRTPLLFRESEPVARQYLDVFFGLHTALLASQWSRFHQLTAADALTAVPVPSDDTLAMNPDLSAHAIAHHCIQTMQKYQLVADTEATDALPIPESIVGIDIDQYVPGLDLTEEVVLKPYDAVRYIFSDMPLTRASANSDQSDVATAAYQLVYWDTNGLPMDTALLITSLGLDVQALVTPEPSYSNFLRTRVYAYWNVLFDAVEMHIPFHWSDQETRDKFPDLPATNFDLWTGRAVDATDDRKRYIFREMRDYFSNQLITTTVDLYKTVDAFLLDLWTLYFPRSDAFSDGYADTPRTDPFYESDAPLAVGAGPHNWMQYFPFPVHAISMYGGYQQINIPYPRDDGLDSMSMAPDSPFYGMDLLDPDNEQELMVLAQDGGRRPRAADEESDMDDDEPLGRRTRALVPQIVSMGQLQEMRARKEQETEQQLVRSLETLSSSDESTWWIDTSVLSDRRMNVFVNRMMPARIGFDKWTVYETYIRALVSNESWYIPEDHPLRSADTYSAKPVRIYDVGRERVLTRAGIQLEVLNNIPAYAELDAFPIYQESLDIPDPALTTTAKCGSYYPSSGRLVSMIQTPNGILDKIFRAKDALFMSTQMAPFDHHQSLAFHYGEFQAQGGNDSAIQTSAPGHADNMFYSANQLYKHGHQIASFLAQNSSHDSRRTELSVLLNIMSRRPSSDVPKSWWNMVNSQVRETTLKLSFPSKNHHEVLEFARDVMTYEHVDYALTALAFLRARVGAAEASLAGKSPATFAEDALSSPGNTYGTKLPMFVWHPKTAEANKGTLFKYYNTHYGDAILWRLFMDTHGNADERQVFTNAHVPQNVVSAFIFNRMVKTINLAAQNRTSIISVIESFTTRLHEFLNKLRFEPDEIRVDDIYRKTPESELLDLVYLVYKYLYTPTQALSYWVLNGATLKIQTQRANALGWTILPEAMIDCELIPVIATAQTKKTRLGWYVHIPNTDADMTHLLQTDGALVRFMPDFDWTPEFSHVTPVRVTPEQIETVYNKTLFQFVEYTLLLRSMRGDTPMDADVRTFATNFARRVGQHLVQPENQQYDLNEITTEGTVVFLGNAAATFAQEMSQLSPLYQHEAVMFKDEARAALVTLFGVSSEGPDGRIDRILDQLTTRFVMAWERVNSAFDSAMPPVLTCNMEYTIMFLLERYIQMFRDQTGASVPAKAILRLTEYEKVRRQQLELVMKDGVTETGFKGFKELFTNNPVESWYSEITIADETDGRVYRTNEDCGACFTTKSMLATNVLNGMCVDSVVFDRVMLVCNWRNAAIQTTAFRDDGTQSAAVPDLRTGDRELLAVALVEQSVADIARYFSSIIENEREFYEYSEWVYDDMPFQIPDSAVAEVSQTTNDDVPHTASTMWRYHTEYATTTPMFRQYNNPQNTGPKRKTAFTVHGNQLTEAYDSESGNAQQHTADQAHVRAQRLPKYVMFIPRARSSLVNPAWSNAAFSENAAVPPPTFSALRVTKPESGSTVNIYNTDYISTLFMNDSGLLYETNKHGDDLHMLWNASTVGSNARSTLNQFAEPEDMVQPSEDMPWSNAIRVAMNNAVYNQLASRAFMTTAVSDPTQAHETEGLNAIFRGATFKRQWVDTPAKPQTPTSPTATPTGFHLSWYTGAEMDAFITNRMAELLTNDAWQSAFNFTPLNRNTRQIMDACRERRTGDSTVLPYRIGRSKSLYTSSFDVLRDMKWIDTAQLSTPQFAHTAAKYLAHRRYIAARFSVDRPLSYMARGALGAHLYQRHKWITSTDGNDTNTPFPISPPVSQRWAF